MVTFVGQAPSRQTKDNAGWAEGRAVLALCALARMPYRELAAQARFVNLLRRWPGKRGKGDRWPINRAQRAAQHVQFTGRMVFLGRQVAAAFGASRAYLRPFQLRGATCMVFPHPSGVNRWYNQAKNKRRASQMLKRWLNG